MDDDLSKKIALAEDVIRDFYEKNNGNVYISYSGGKDSTVMRHIALNIYPEIETVFGDTTNERKEIYDYVKKDKSIIWVRPTITFIEFIKKYGFPLVSKEVSNYVYEARNSNSEKLVNKRIYGDENGNFKIPKKWLFLTKVDFNISANCCKRLKKDPLDKWGKENNKKPLVALMAGESRLRDQLSKKGPNNPNKCYPFLKNGWTNDDIWEYAKRFNIRFAECYYDSVVNGVKINALERTGCEFCGFGVHLEDKSRFERTKILTPKRYDKIMNIKNNGVTFHDALKCILDKNGRKLRQLRFKI